MSQSDPQRPDETDEDHVEVDEEQLRIDPIETDNLSGRSESWNRDEAAYLLDTINENQRRIAEEINRIPDRIETQGEAESDVNTRDTHRLNNHSIPGTSNPSPVARAVYISLVSAGIVLATLGLVLSLIFGSVAITIAFVPVLAFLSYAAYRGMK